MNVWTTKEDQTARAMWADGMSGSDIAKAMSRMFHRKFTRSAVLGYANRNKFTRRTTSGSQWTNLEIITLRLAWQNSESTSEIVRKINNISPVVRQKRTILHKANKLGLGKRRLTKRDNAVIKPVLRPVEMCFEAHGGHLLDVDESRCVWIVGEPINGLCCFKPTANGIYCKEHCKRAYASN